MDIFGKEALISNNTISNISGYGIKLDNIEHFYSLKNNKITNNHLENNSVGINLKMTIDDIVENNTIINCDHGIYSDNSLILGIKNNIIQGTNNSIRMLNGNRYSIYDNTLSGIEKGIWMSSCEAVNISSNLIDDHPIGITMDDCVNVKLLENDFLGYESGVLVDSRTRGLVVSRNNFFGSGVHASDEGVNDWDLNGLGNYWSGVPDQHDWDGDGIVDEPFPIDGDSADHYPLIVPWGQPWNRKIELGHILSERSVEATKWCNLTFTASDPDGDIPLFSIECDRDVYFDLDCDTGSFSYHPLESDVGVLVFNVTVFDRNGTRDNATFLIDVLHKNHPPDVQAIDPIRAYPGDLVRVRLVFSDRNGDTVYPSINHSDAPFNLFISEEGYLTFRAKDDQAGFYHVLLKFSDNNGSYSYLPIDIEIVPFNIPPDIQPVPDQTAYVGELFLYRVHATDPNDDILSFSITYSGSGYHSIDDLGMINIEPTASDIGVRMVTVNVSDNNGSYALIEFRMHVRYRNDPPEGPSFFRMVVQAGDVYEQNLPVSDPDGDTLTSEFGETVPAWVKLSADLLITLTPVLGNVGIYSLALNISDGKLGYLEMFLEIEVVAGEVPLLLVDEPLQLLERETRSISLATDHSGNCTIAFELVDEMDWVGLNGGELVLSPEDGDSGSYSVSIRILILGGTSGVRNITVDVFMNLSTLECSIVLDPIKARYDVGEEISYVVNYVGYGGDLHFILIVIKDGQEHIRFFEYTGSLLLNESGSYELALEVEGYDLVVADVSFDVVGSSEASNSVYPLIILIVLLILTVFIGSLILYFHLRSRINVGVEEDRVSTGTISEDEGSSTSDIPQGTSEDRSIK